MADFLSVGLGNALLLRRSERSHDTDESEVPDRARSSRLHPTGRPGKLDACLAALPRHVRQVGRRMAFFGATSSAWPSGKMASRIRASPEEYDATTHFALCSWVPLEWLADMRFAAHSRTPPLEV
jgi:hypothetical protein